MAKRSNLFKPFKSVQNGVWYIAVTESDVKPFGCSYCALIPSESFPGCSAHFPDSYCKDVCNAQAGCEAIMYVRYARAKDVLASL